jgi:hypothetical protein
MKAFIPLPSNHSADLSLRLAIVPSFCIAERYFVLLSSSRSMKESIGMARVENAPLDWRYGVKSLGRALDLLDVLTGHDGASLAEISRTIHMSKPAAYAILQTYLARGLVADFGEGPQRRYRLGLGLARLGDAALRNLGLVDLAMPCDLMPLSAGASSSIVRR